MIKKKFKMPTKRCSRCKLSKTINHFSAGEWRREGSDGRKCSKCVAVHKPNHGKTKGRELIRLNWTFSPRVYTTAGGQKIELRKPA